MKRTFYYSFLLPGIFAFYGVSAQSKTKVEKDKIFLDSVKATCPDIPLQKRPRLTVARFNVTAPNAPQDEFGDNLATMLSNALQGVNCYRVLERLKNSSDLLDEQNFQQGENVKKSTAVKKGQMAGANVIVTGEVVRYEVSSKNLGIGIVSSQKSNAAIGINIKLTNPETRDIIASHIFTAEKKVQGKFGVGIGVPLLGNINAVSSAMSNPAVQGAVEDAINQAVVYISNERDKVPFPEGSLPDNATESSIAFQNIPYEKVPQLAGAIEKIEGVYSVNSDQFENGIATIVIGHSLKVKDLIAKILAANTGVKLSVQGVSKDGATMAVKN